MLSNVIDMIFVSVSGLIFVGFIVLQNSLGDISKYEENKPSYSNEKIEIESKNKSFFKKRKQ